MEVSDVLGLLGNPGLYQLIIYFCLILCNSTISMNHLILSVWKYTPKVYSCASYQYSNATCSNETCSSGWTFETNGKVSSIVTEWSLVCGDKDKVGAATSIYFAGVTVGGLLFGQLADTFGRKPVLLFSMYGHILLGIGVYFVPSYNGFVAIRFFVGMLVQGLQTSSYVLLIEMTIKKYRPICAGIFEVFWAVGNLWMTILAWAIQDWRSIQLALCLPSLITLIYIVVLPESIRWSVLHGKNKQAEYHIGRIASFNMVTLPEELNLFVAQKDSKKVSFHHLYRTPNIRKRTLLMGYIWLASSIGYYGIALSIGNLAGDRFLNIFISALVEVVAFIMVLFILKFLPRRLPLGLYYVIGGSACIIAGCVKDNKNIVDGPLMGTVFALIGKFFIAAAFSTIFLFTVELFPTNVRSIGMGSCVFWARIGGIIAPQILRLGNIFNFKELPYLIFGCLQLVASVAIIFVPETRGIKLMETIEDLENTDRGTSPVILSLQEIPDDTNAKLNT